MCESILIDGAAIRTDTGWITEGHIYIEGKQITAIENGKAPAALRQGAQTIINGQYKAVIPGLNNGHTHFAQTFMRGLAGGRPLMSWLSEKIWPLQKKMTPEDMRLSAQLAILENLQCGVSSVTNHHKITASEAHTEAVLEAAKSMGIQMTLARSWTNGEGCEDDEDILNDLNRLHKRYSGNRMIRISNGPLAPWRCSPELLKKSHELSKSFGGKTHIHIAEVRGEWEQFRKAYEMTPIQWLEKAGCLDNSVELVHTVWVDENDMDLIAASGAAVIHCPVSNCVLGSGIAPLSGFISRGIPVSLGTDGPASNDNQDIFETAKSALCLARVSTEDPTVLSPDQALSMAANGGELRNGGFANLTVVNLNHSRAVPVNDPASALVLSCSGSDVETVICDGQLLLYNGKCSAVDEQTLFSECREAVERLV